MTEGEHIESVLKVPHPENPAPRKWFALEVPSAHTGGGRGQIDTHSLYVWARDIMEALDKGKRMRGWKRSGPQSKHSFPNIRELSPEETEELKKRMTETNVPVALAKKTRILWNKKRRKLKYFETP